jgi:hypothetical protein
VREIEEEQSISMTTIISIKKEEYMILFLKEKKDEPKPINEHQQRQPLNS